MENGKIAIHDLKERNWTNWSTEFHLINQAIINNSLFIYFLQQKFSNGFGDDHWCSRILRDKQQFNEILMFRSP